MKKSLLLSGMLAACSLGAFAADEATAPVTVYDNMILTKISNNGRYIVSEVYGYMTVINLETGENQTFGTEQGGGGGIAFKPAKLAARLFKAPAARDGEEVELEYHAGLGRSISNEGILVGSQTYHGDASIMENGQWSLLPVKKGDVLSNSANAITSDARRICGYVGRGALGADMETPNTVPVVWNLGTDGSYGMYEELPYPAKDFSGRVPQYVLATEISDDGKTIAGQIIDYMGVYPEPVVWTQDADGKWTCVQPLKKVFYREGVEWPVYPGDFDKAAPVQTQYMTADKRAEYETKCQEWVNSGYQQDLYPDPNDYLTEEEKALFDADTAKYQEEYDAWNEKFEAFQTFYWEYAANLPGFIMNLNILSFNGRYLVECQQVQGDPDPSSWGRPTVTATPYLIDLQSGEYGPMDSEGKSMLPTYVNDDCKVLASYPADSYSPQTQICEGAKAKFGPLAEWFLEEGYDDVYNWVIDNMEHEVVTGYEYPEEGEPIEIREKQIITGMAWATPHMKQIVSYALDNWTPADVVDVPWIYGYSFVMGREDGFSGIQAVDTNVQKQVVDRTYYDLQGRRISHPASGSIIVEKVTYTDGSVNATKRTF